MEPTYREYLLLTNEPELAQRMNQFAPQGVSLKVVPASQGTVRQLWQAGTQQVVFFDFYASEHVAQMAKLVRDCAQWEPDCQRVAVGNSTCSDAVLEALRAGVHEFVNLNQPDSLANELIRVTSVRPAAATPMRATSCPHIMLLGARAGVGTSTLAASLAYILQQHCNEQVGDSKDRDVSTLPLQHRVALLDLGWPTGDAALYLDVHSDFDFIQAALERQRLDETMLSAALAQHSSGVNVLSLPSDPQRLHQLSSGDASSVGAYLRSTMASVVVDGGGFPNPALLKELEADEQELLLVCDQSLSALVALADTLAERARQSLSKQPKLIVNQYDTRYGLSAEAIAKRFDLELLAVLPDRRAEHMGSASVGKLLVQTHEKDSYTRAVQGLCQSLMASGYNTLSSPAASSLWGQMKTSWGRLKPKKNKVRA